MKKWLILLTSYQLFFCLCCKYCKIHLYIIESATWWLGMLKFMAIFADG